MKKPLKTKNKPQKTFLHVQDAKDVSVFGVLASQDISSFLQVGILFLRSYCPCSFQ